METAAPRDSLTRLGSWLAFALLVEANALWNQTIPFYHAIIDFSPPKRALGDKHNSFYPLHSFLCQILTTNLLEFIFSSTLTEHWLLGTWPLEPSSSFYFRIFYYTLELVFTLDYETFYFKPFYFRLDIYRARGWRILQSRQRISWSLCSPLLTHLVNPSLY